MKASLLHGAGYAGGEVIRLLSGHPDVTLEQVTSRAFAGRPVWHAHAPLRGTTDLVFSDETADVTDADVVFIAAEHGKGAEAVVRLLESGYQGAIVDISADFRFRDTSIYERYFKFTHPAPELLSRFQYGLPEVYGPYPDGTRYVANPGCFATALALALYPVARSVRGMTAHITALTGASGSGTRPKEGTHFPTREGNVRVYKVFSHQHEPEVQALLGPDVTLNFVPASGPWTRGIWGTAHLELPAPLSSDRLSELFQAAYEGKPFVRLWPDELPELRYSVDTPFCDIGWIVRDQRIVVGFALDNLLKGAAAQAVQNMNLILGLQETAGLLGRP